MLPSLSVSGLMSDLCADATTIAFDLPDGGYDRLHAFLESRGVLPASNKGRVTLIALMLLASRIVKQQLGTLGPVANFLNEIKDDGIREEAKRILESVLTTDNQERDAGPSEDALWQMDEGDRTRLLTLYASLDEDARGRLRSHLTVATAARLAAVAHLTPDQLKLVLDIISPRRAPKAPVPSVVSGALNTVNDFFFPWMRGVSS